MNSWVDVLSKLSELAEKLIEQLENALEEEKQKVLNVKMEERDSR